MSDEQERINEQVYEKQYLATNDSDSFIKKGESSPCPFCLDDITEDESYQVLISYGISKQNTSGSTHMEIYHENCWKQLQKAIYEIEKKMQNANK